MSLIPKKLAIYYGYPSLVNSSNGNITKAVSVFKDYDMVVFGSGLEQITHPDNVKTKSIIGNSTMINTQVYGYIDSTISLSAIYIKIELWKSMGAKGIMCDRFGYDFGLTRTKQNSIIDYIHTKNLKAMVNAWEPDDVFGKISVPIKNPLKIASTINSGDWYLAAPYQIVSNTYQPVSEWKSKSDKMAVYKTQFGTKMACITTTNSNTFDSSKMDYGYYSTTLYNFDAFGWTESNFSATDSKLPFRTRKYIEGTKFISPITQTGPSFNRATNIGISINTKTHKVSTTLN